MKRFLTEKWEFEIIFLERRNEITVCPGKLVLSTLSTMFTITKPVAAIPFPQDLCTKCVMMIRVNL